MNDNLYFSSSLSTRRKFRKTGQGSTSPSLELLTGCKFLDETSLGVYQIFRKTFCKIIGDSMTTSSMTSTLETSVNQKIDNFQISTSTSRVELKFILVLDLDKRQRFAQFQVGHLCVFLNYKKYLSWDPQVELTPNVDQRYLIKNLIDCHHFVFVAQTAYIYLNVFTVHFPLDRSAK